MSAEPRLLSAAVPEDRAGRTVKSLLKSEFHMAEGYIAALKLRPDGIRLDGEKNAADERVISSPDSRVRVLVIPANEELGVARRTVAYMEQHP